MLKTLQRCVGRASLARTSVFRTAVLRSSLLTSSAWLKQLPTAPQVPIRLFSSLGSQFKKTSCGLYVDRSLPATFNKILIANRGEIACRVIRTCRELGVKTVAVYSDADANSMHVQMADEAYRIGEPVAAKSYLLGENIIDLAKRVGAQAIHPGYGFLSENAEFAELCEKNGVVFMGPPASAIRAMGSKSASKEIMTKAGVPVVPGYHGKDQSMERLRLEAERVGYPIMIKAVLGGGGKGMRIVHTPDELQEAVDACKREALKSFKSEDVLLERYIVRPRHIEFQVFADQHGQAVHFFERDCSVQRRHQKVLEEAPAPGMSAELRAKMGKSATDAAKAVGYVGAGTVEFIFDADTDEYFFMEMNTRLQVEHPVTEMIMRRDLVQLQLHVASGHKLPVEQSELSNHGHAIEARIYAENPENNFLPCIGKLTHLRTPAGSDDVRVETGVREGDEVSMYYDPMIAKLLTWGPDRETALKRMHAALGQYQIVGPPTNIAFVRRAVLHPTFMRGQVDTGFIAANRGDLLPKPGAVPANSVTGLAVLYMLLAEQHAAKTADPQSPWSEASMWRSNLTSVRRVKLNTAPIPGVEVGPENPTNTLEVDVTYQADNSSFSFKFADGQTLTARGRLTGPRDLAAQIGEATFQATVVKDGVDVHVFSQGEKTHFQLPKVAFGASGAGGKGAVAPMSGRVVKVLVKDGEAVKKNAPLVIMEAMKMEHVIRAPADAVVDKVLFNTGDFVEGGKVLATFQKPKAK